MLEFGFWFCFSFHFFFPFFVLALCHGLGIVDTNELNSYLNYCSHRREYQIWREKHKRNLSTGRKGVLSMGSVAALLLSLLAGQDGSVC